MTGIPRILGHRYEVGDLIGRGGMAEVHIGKDTRINRVVAIKILREDMASDPVFQARFRREAQSAGGINHPTIVGVYDTGEEPITTYAGATVNLPYIVMEYIEGHTVRALLAEGDAVPINEAVQITLGVLDALEYSHNKGIVHRDIKPGNIMLTNAGDTKVMDFGIARAMADTQVTMTQTNSVVGTAQYLSPEQARGENVDSRSDLYSTGCLIYELLTGRPPFKGENATSVAVQHVQKLPTPPSKIAGDVPEALDRIVMKALAKDKDKRYQTASAFKNDLIAALRGLAVVAPPVDTWSRQANLQANEITRRQKNTQAISQSTAVVASSEKTEIFNSISGHPQSQPYRPRNDFQTQLQPAVTVTDSETQKEKGRLSVILLWIMAIFLVVGSGFVVYALFFNQSKPAPMPSETVALTKVPQLEGLDETGVRTALANANLEYLKAADQPSDTIAKGQFVDSSPKPGQEVAKGTVVKVSFSSGPNKVTLPDIKNNSQEEARNILEKLGLKVGNVTTVNEAGAQTGKVLRTKPAAGENVDTGASIELLIASGNLEVPNVLNLTKQKAIDKLTAAGLIPEIVFQPANVTPDIVIAQNPDNGLVKVNSTIRLIISQKPSNPPDNNDNDNGSGNNNGGGNGHNGN